ncbi:ATP-binding protein [Oscillatoria acuminata]|uniref:Nuclease SbcCD subunit C n=1 Tax=Oscillatoria acuminata PCC 6304 TaxID=56110 RepID=K9TBT9_9CYAN|nr:ATP-binding protein [Oscillatoria acuminata]AFY80332.1 hypothetical protein Oscil6304_0592 [Oscillatoria acuminata PCC 6304]
MKIQFNKISLLGTGRDFHLQPGLNIITGSITTGKTTLIKCFRGVLGSTLKNFSREARKHITHLTGEILIENDVYEIIRPFVTTKNALVSIAGENEAERLPVLVGSSDQQTYGTWLLKKLDLPILQVLTAPTQESSSNTSPLSINDYMMYCYLSQDEIDGSVFGHTYPAKNIKRKYVFEVIYGKYDVEIAQLNIERSKKLNEIHRLKNYTKTIEEFLEGTPFDNKAQIDYDLNNIIQRLESVSSNSETLGQQIRHYANTDELRQNLLKIEQKLTNLNRERQNEQYSLEQKERLINQLRTQSIRLTKAIVAGQYLLDFDFFSCPRCGSSIQPSRSQSPIDQCYLCLQKPEPQVTQNDLIKEQKRLGDQITETLELVTSHSNKIANIEQAIRDSNKHREILVSEIDHRSRRYVSEQAERIALFEQQRTHLQEQKQRLEEYLELYNRQEQVISSIQQLEYDLEKINIDIALANNQISNFENYLNFLDNTYNEILQEFHVPSFSDPGPSIIDRETYLPRFEGRRFNELESQGLKVMVNIAHIIAHQITSLHFNLKLPNILIIDGLSGNMGYEGLDLERIEAIYNYIIKFSNLYQNRLQIIISDNTIPKVAEEYVLAEFNEDNKLIPL